ncbi:hypothetical protein CHS0354_017692 [Potamilus streckersoni]|uniref:J domain-containing protein n=1 Tax=Potamilus streckersoni TaxID=2493646 RepID=A0AAE0S7Q3_9BIVA|nr:hypothetical protein CHS0354_017692 [Potamilus streckersoni]
MANMSLSSLLVICGCFCTVTSDFVDHYATLGVCRDADTEEIEAAYTHLMELFDPEKKGDNESSDESVQFITTIEEAYKVLRDPEGRETYNRNHLDVGICKSWWNSLRGEWDKLTISYGRKDLHNSIIQTLHDVFFNCQILTFHFIRNVVTEVPIFMSKLKNATDNWINNESIRWTGFSSSSETSSRSHGKIEWFFPEYPFLNVSFSDDFFMVFGLSLVCLISKYLSRSKVVQAVSFPFIFDPVIFPIWLAVYLPLLILRKMTVIFALVLVFIEIAVYRTFARQILSDIFQNVDEGINNHEMEIFYYILVATIISFPVFIKYQNQIQFLTPMCIGAVTHIATCIAVFKAMPFADAVSFFLCLTMLIILIDKFPTAITTFMYLLVQTISGYCLDASQILVTLTISLVFMSCPISYLFEGARQSSLYYLQLLWWRLKWHSRFQTMDDYNLVGKEETLRALQALREYCKHDENGAIPNHLRDDARFQQFLKGVDYIGETKHEEQIQETNVMTLRQEISFYLILSICCIFVIFIYEFY